VRVDEGMDCFKTKRIRKDIKVFGLYRSMIEKEAEKINSAVLKYIIMFVVIISLCKVLGAFCPRLTNWRALRGESA
jgi:hypothetical protein